MIVDALREYKHPIYIYFPPYGELRGGSWVVVDPSINDEKMTMFSDPEARGGILEPAGIVEIKFRLADQLKAMHRIDPQLQMLDAEFDSTDDTDNAAQEAIKEQIAAKEELLKPVYLQAATEFADLHDKTGRMKAKGVIKEAVPWASLVHTSSILPSAALLRTTMLRSSRLLMPRWTSRAHSRFSVACAPLIGKTTKLCLSTTPHMMAPYLPRLVK